MTTPETVTDPNDVVGGLLKHLEEEHAPMIFASKAHIADPKDPDSAICGAAHIDPERSIKANVIQIPDTADMCASCIRHGAGLYRYQIMAGIADLVGLDDFDGTERNHFTTDELRVIHENLENSR